jgi:hypothetical protein
VTDLLDERLYPADDLLAVYLKRWEIETCQADSTSSDRWCGASGAGYDRRRRAA